MTSGRVEQPRLLLRRRAGSGRSGPGGSPPARRPRACSRMRYATTLLLRRALREEERERDSAGSCQAQHRSDCIVEPCTSRPTAVGSRSGCSTGSTTPETRNASSSGSSARPARVWAVGRAVNPEQRNGTAPRPDDYIFEGYELERRARAGERGARGRPHRLGAGRARRALPPVHARRGAEAARGLVLRALRQRRAAIEVRVGDRIPVRIVRRKAERPVDPRLELLRDRVLEPVGLSWTSSTSTPSVSAR